MSTLATTNPDEDPKLPEGSRVGSWLSRIRQKIDDQTKFEPIDCPRGWGPVSFVGSVRASIWDYLPFVGIERTCPIGGVSECSECTYDVKPDVFRLGEQLRELKTLRSEDAITESEYELLRESLIFLHQPPDPGDGYRIAAWIVGPIGGVLAIAGTALAIGFHPGFWVLCLLGSVASVLGVSFWGLSRNKSSPRLLKTSTEQSTDS